MTTLTIKLKDIVVDLEGNIDLESLPPEETLSRVRECYDFLPAPLDVSIDGDVATIKSLKPSPKNVSEVPELLKRATKQAGSGNYHRVIEVCKRILDRAPDNIEARRNLAMAYLETGNVDLARSHLVEVTRLQPDDAWTYLLLANSYAKNEDNPGPALRFYHRAYAIDAEDPFILCSYGGTLIKTGNSNRGRELLEEARDLAPTHPNSYYGIALVDAQAGLFNEALSTLESLFAQATSKDLRSQPVYDAARALYLKTSHDLAQHSYDRLMTVIDDRKVSLEQQTGFGIRIEEDRTLRVSAVTQMAWNHKADFHRIRHENKNKALTPHHLAHELEHISLEHEARKSDRNRAFATSVETREHAIRAVEDHVYRLKRQGYPDDVVTDLILDLTSGLANQLFNIPLDMIIEYRVFTNLPELHPSQVASLHTAQVENTAILTNADIRKATPPLIFEASTSLNCAFALLVDHLYEGRTSYASAYKTSSVFSAGQAIFKIWQKIIADYQHGDEYKFVDECAKLLKLDQWYIWHMEGVQPTPVPQISLPAETPQGTTNPELLKSKEMASVMHCLGALQRFEGMDKPQMLQIASEIATVGTNGIDYSDPDTQYHLSSIPNESFTGLQLLSLMYVAFKQLDPNLDTGLDLKDAYNTALQLHEAGR